MKPELLRRFYKITGIITVIFTLIIPIRRIAEKINSLLDYDIL